MGPDPNDLDEISITGRLDRASNIPIPGYPIGSSCMEQVARHPGNVCAATFFHAALWRLAVHLLVFLLTCLSVVQAAGDATTESEPSTRVADT